MSGVRPPTVAGVGGGVGTTTLATALRGHDAGRGGVTGGDLWAADILACRATFDSLRQAVIVLERTAGPGPRPVLAVTLGAARIPRGQLQARLELLDDATSGVVLLPHVGHWATTVDPLQEAAGLLLDPAPPPRALRAYAAALRELAAAVTDSGRLRTSTPRTSTPRAPAPPPSLPRRRPGESWTPAPTGPTAPPSVRDTARAPDGAPTPAAGIRVGVPPRVVEARPEAPAPPAAPPARPAVPRGVRIVTAVRRPSDGRQVG